ncbi:hypothetical protein MMB25_25315, partial [Salmonella enterica]|nr:hypothetical protein [Salmonella enterica]MCH5740173.1 hypothetical protein [Salmonella enterica]MCH5745209.1 hypothetical protein [Salmonella enterica]MCH5750196.1 hypothetical protein [Salmonella enterica]MCH5759992.1 hypothetical protein [Salmonella enterica]
IQNGSSGSQTGGSTFTICDTRANKYACGVKVLPLIEGGTASHPCDNLLAVPLLLRAINNRVDSQNGKSGSQHKCGGGVSPGVMTNAV